MRTSAVYPQDILGIIIIIIVIIIIMIIIIIITLFKCLMYLALQC